MIEYLATLTLVFFLGCIAGAVAEFKKSNKILDNILRPHHVVCDSCGATVEEVSHMACPECGNFTLNYKPKAIKPNLRRIR